MNTPSPTERTPLLVPANIFSEKKVPVTSYSSTAVRDDGIKIREHQEITVAPFSSFAPPKIVMEILSGPHSIAMDAEHAPAEEKKKWMLPEKLENPDAFSITNGICVSKSQAKAFCLDKKRLAEEHDELATKAKNEELAIIWGSAAIHWQQAADALDNEKYDLFPLYQKAGNQAELEAKNITQLNSRSIRTPETGPERTLS